MTIEEALEKELKFYKNKALQLELIIKKLYKMDDLNDIKDYIYTQTDIDVG